MTLRISIIPAASHGEHGVADKGDAIVVKHIADVAERMPWDFPDIGLVAAKRYSVTLVQRDVQAGHPAVLACRADDGRACCFLDREIPARVIGVPMGVEDLVDPPSAPLSFRKHRIGIARIDDSRLARIGVVNQPQIIVSEGWNRDDLKRRGHHQLPVFGMEAQGSAGSRSPF